MPDVEAQKMQIKTILKQRYFPMILQLPWNRDAEWHEKNRLSRSLAAFAIEKLADAAPVQAANAVIDGGDDNGIDSIFFDRMNNRLYLVQSKVGGAPDMGDNKKLCDGIRDLVAGRFARFNQGFARLQTEVEEALETEGLQIVGCNVHLGDQLGPHAIADLSQLEIDLNQFHERFSWKDLKLSACYAWLSTEHAIASPTVTLSLKKWFGCSHPRRAFYGLVSADQLATLYHDHGKSLFEKNIRHYLGAQSVNTAITATVHEKPSELFYLNNGLTAVCSRITPAPGATNEQGSFTLYDFSVVNGAQTVGSIATAKTVHGAISPEANILITLIEVGTATDNLGPEITRARNTQNEVRGLHFAALDPNQERLRCELAVSNIVYHYRPSAEAILGGANVITLQKAALALSCLSGKTKTIVVAKKEIGLIYNRNGEFYPILFGDNLSGVYLCRAVRIFEYLNEIFNNSENAETDFYRRMFYRHGRFFILHILARRNRPLIDKPEIELSDADKLELSRVTLELAELIYTRAEALFNRSKGYLSIFRNLTDAEPLARDVMQSLAQAAAP